MPKASSLPEEMYAPSGRGFVEKVGTDRLGEVTGAVVRYHQWQANKKTGVQQAPLTALFLSIKEIDAQGNQTSEPVDTELVVEWGPKDDSIIRVRPGNAANSTTDPEDTRDENGNLSLGSEGNTFYVDEGVQINRTNAYGIFVSSLKEKGFKPDVLRNSYMPDFVGLRAKFSLKPGKKKDDGTEFNDFVVSDIIRFPYEAAAAKPAAAAPKAKAKPAAAPAPAAASAPAPAAAPVASPAAYAGTDDEISAKSVAFLTTAVAKRSAKGDSTCTHQQLVAAALQEVLADKSLPKDDLKKYQTLMKDRTWFLENGISFGAIAGDGDQFILTA